MTVFASEKVATEIDALIEREGDYVDHPADRGGPTRWGITEHVARAGGYKGEMRQLPRERAVQIYLNRYWLDPKFPLIANASPALALELFDGGVNMGPMAATKLLQRALNYLNSDGRHYPDIAMDGVAGNMTLHSLDCYYQRRGRDEGERVLLWLVRALRSCRYVGIAEADHSQEAFGYGWIARQVREMTA